ERQRLQFAKDQQAEVSGLLSKNQLDRFTQIALQHRGPMAFSEPNIVAQLGLNTDQRTEIRKRLSNYRDPFFPRPKNPPFDPSDGEKPIKKFPFPERDFRADDQILTDFLNLLSPEQRAKWKEMTGEPFQGEIPRTFLSPPRRR
ncbi:MAG: hypothetical protein KDA84_16290, partial [Planctomycetaceae bacterium]|nr:hypothetical protein [Planctomycetaceae bacterium]